MFPHPAGCVVAAEVQPPMSDIARGITIAGFLRARHMVSQ